LGGGGDLMLPISRSVNTEHIEQCSVFDT